MILLDTTVLIDIRRGKVEIKDILEKYNDTICGISVITIYELYVGLGHILQKFGEISYKTNKEKTEKLLNDFEIFDLNRLILEKAGLKEGELLAKGITIEFEDIIIGITAQILKAEKIITRNPEHFKYFEIPVQSYQFR